MASDKEDSLRTGGSLFFSLRVLGILVLVLPACWIQLYAADSTASARQLLRRWARRALRWSGCSCRLEGTEHLPSGPHATLLTANHSSALDSIVLMAALPADYCFVANHLAATRPLVGLAIARAGYLVVNRRSAVSRTACARAITTALAGGSSILLFPEGTRSEADLLPLQPGPFRIATSVGCTVTPVTISGTRQILPRRFRLLRRASIVVRVLPPVRHDPHSPTPALALRDRVAEALRTAIDSSEPARSQTGAGQLGISRAMDR